MKYVLDVSVAMRWVIPGPLMVLAVKLRDEYLQNIHELIAPDIFPGEAASGLTKAERQKLIAIGDAATLHTKIMNTCPDLRLYSPLTPRAIDISSQSRTAFYDCLYIALAELEQIELVTADDKLVNNVQRQFPFVVHLSAIP